MLFKTQNNYQSIYKKTTKKVELEQVITDNIFCWNFSIFSPLDMSCEGTGTVQVSCEPGTFKRISSSPVSTRSLLKNRLVCGCI